MFTFTLRGCTEGSWTVNNSWGFTLEQEGGQAQSWSKRRPEPGLGRHLGCFTTHTYSCGQTVAVPASQHIMSTWWVLRSRRYTHHRTWYHLLCHTGDKNLVPHQFFPPSIFNKNWIYSTIYLYYIKVIYSSWPVSYLRCLLATFSTYSKPRMRLSPLHRAI